MSALNALRNVPGWLEEMMSQLRLINPAQLTSQEAAALRTMRQSAGTTAHEAFRAGDEGTFNAEHMKAAALNTPLNELLVRSQMNPTTRGLVLPSNTPSVANAAGAFSFDDPTQTFLPPFSTYVSDLGSTVPGGGRAILQRIANMHPDSPMFLHSKEIPKTLDFYLSRGFQPLQRHELNDVGGYSPDTTSNLPLMYLPKAGDMRAAAALAPAALHGGQNDDPSVTDPKSLLDRLGDILSNSDLSVQDPTVPLSFLGGPIGVAAGLMGSDDAGAAEDTVHGNYASGGPIRMAGGGGVLRLLKQAMTAIGEHGESALAGPPGTLGVVKPKGGQWLNGSVEDALKPLRKTAPTDVLAGMTGMTREEFLNLPKEERASIASGYIGQGGVSLNNWIDSNLTNYVKNQMGTPEDPIRALAEQGVLHYEPHDATHAANFIRLQSPNGSQMGKSDLAKKWEAQGDRAIHNAPASSYTEDLSLSGEGMPAENPWTVNNPWLNKLPADEPVSMWNNGRTHRDLGFDHIIDVLNGKLQDGTLRPETLNRVSVPDAVRFSHDANLAQAKKMEDARLAAMQDMPVHKDYGDGFRWMELKKPDTPEGYVEDGTAYRNATDESQPWIYPIDKLQDWLTQEGDAMGHCVGGYCDDVLSGNTRIFSLRDAQGEPHVTIETKPSPTLTPEKRNAQMDFLVQRLMGEGKTEEQAMKEALNLYPESETHESIIQIKGKQNKAPIDSYLPYVQDFVKNSGPWSDVGDLQNSGLRNIDDVFNQTEQQRLRNMGVHPETQYITPDEASSLQNQGWPSVPTDSSDFASGGTVKLPTSPITAPDTGGVRGYWYDDEPSTQQTYWYH